MMVKICGLSTLEATEVAIEAGADALGFVLAPSPRQVTLEKARELLAIVPEHIETVGVFAKATREELEAADEVGFRALQREFGSPSIKLRNGSFALSVWRDGEDLEQRIEEHDQEDAARGSYSPGSLRGALVLDGPKGGGQGVPVDLERARRIAHARPIILAGGLTPENVAERIHAVAPIAVDTSSGVEKERGIKDPKRIRAFIQNARSAFEKRLR